MFLKRTTWHKFNMSKTVLTETCLKHNARETLVRNQQFVAHCAATVILFVQDNQQKEV